MPMLATQNEMHLMENPVVRKSLLIDAPKSGKQTLLAMDPLTIAPNVGHIDPTIGNFTIQRATLSHVDLGCID